VKWNKPLEGWISDIVKIRSFSESSKIAHFESKTSIGDMTHVSGAYMEDLEQIPPSKEILVRLGFKVQEKHSAYWTFFILESGFYITKALHSEPSAGVEVGKYYWGDNYIEIESIHHLQNLYNVLTKKELQLI
jgi:hypothetical protein